MVKRGVIIAKEHIGVRIKGNTVNKGFSGCDLVMEAATVSINI